MRTDHIIQTILAAICVAVVALMLSGCKSSLSNKLYSLTAGLIAIIGWITKSWKTASVYWLEMMAFGGTYATVITEILIQMFK